MVERPNTLVCSFDPASPRITAWDIHEWIHDTLRIPEHEVLMVQIDGIRRQVFIKLKNSEQVVVILTDTNGSVDYKYPSGEIFRVNIDHAGLGTKRIRVANLPPEIHDEILREALKPYGKILGVSGENWSKAYRYQVSNGIRNVQIVLSKHVPANLTVAGHRVILSYEGQPISCYSCGDEGHVASTCPTRLRPVEGRLRPRPASYAMVLACTDPHEEPAVTDHLNRNTQRTSIINTTNTRNETYPTISRYGTTDPDRKTSLGDEQVTPQNDKKQPMPPSRPEKVTDTEVVGGDLMETETKQLSTPETLHEQSPMRERSKERKREMTQTTEIDTGGDSDVTDKELTMDIQHLEEGPTSKQGKDTSPKRTKKMKMDKPPAQTHDRSRSGTRRALQKGKLQ